MLKRGGYQKKIWYRLGLWPALPPKKPNIKRIWIQAVSVGELSSIGKLLEEILEGAKYEIVLSGTTSTGLELGNERFGERILAHGPFPLDWFPFSGRAWKKINPDLAILVDSELWPEHFRQASKRNIPLMIVNARLSDRSYSRLKSVPFFWPLLIPQNLKVICPSERQRSRWQDLGVASENLSISGNLKIDANDFGILQIQEKNNLRSEFGFDEESIILAGVSTWPEEEKMLISLTQRLRLENLDLRLLLIPRHAERRMEISKVLESSPLPYQMRTKSKKAPPDNVVYLADTTGEMTELLQVADLAFLGKTLPPNQGGQNPIEPIALSIPLVVGPNYQNFRETCADMFEHGCALRCADQSEIIKKIIALIQNQKSRDQMQDASKKWMDKQGSPTSFTLEKIHTLLS